MRRWLLVVVLLMAGCGGAQASILDYLLSWGSSSVETKGLAIHWGAELTADQVALRDPAGTYATLDDVTIQWSPLKLIHGEIDVRLLLAKTASVLRLPRSSSSGGSSLPKKIAVKKLELDRLKIASSIAGTAVTLKVQGSGQTTAADQAEATLDAESIDDGSLYDLKGGIDPAGIHAQLAVKEAAGGLLANLAGLPNLGALSIDASAQGPRSDLATRLAVHAGNLQVNANGQVDLDGSTLALTVSANAPAMAPRPDLSWESIALSANVKGRFTSPDAAGSLTMEGLAAAGAKIRRIALQLSGNKGQARLSGELDGVVVPGAQPALLAGAPLVVTADARLDAPDRPVSFSLRHPMIDADGTIRTSGVEQADIRLSVPQLGPVAAAVGVDLQGNLGLALNATHQAGTTQVLLNGTLGITGGRAPAPALVGPSARIALAGTVSGETISLTRLAVDAQNVSFAANGTVSPKKTDLGWSMTLASIAAIDPRLDGALRAQGHVTGAEQALSLAADLTGSVNAKGQTSGPFTAHLDAQGLPNAPRGQLTAQGLLLGSPLQLSIAGEKQTDGAVQVSIGQANWKSASAQGDLRLPVAAALPVGNLRFTVQALSDFGPLIGRSLTGSANGSLDATATSAVLSVAAHGAGLPGMASIADAALNATVTDPAIAPVVDGQLVLTGVSVGKLAGSARLAAKGPADGIDLDLAATLPALNGAAARLTTRGIADVTGKTLTLATLNAEWKQQTLRLLAPVAFGFAAGIEIRHLRLGLGDAVVQADGRIGSTLDLTASARNVPASLASLVSPGFAAAGTISADARLTGTPGNPGGTIRAQAAGLRLDTQAWRDLPTGSLAATATLEGMAARIDASLTAGSSHIVVSGRAPFTTTAPLDLRANGLIDLALAGPLVAPQGGGVAGRVTLAANVAGSITRPAGTIRIQASDVRLLTEIGRALPPASMTATATLDGAAARVDTSLIAGKSHLTLTGRAPFKTTEPLDLRATGAIDLAMTDPLLTANGQRLAGTLTLAAGVAGTVTAPRLTGTAQLSGGDVRDYVQGIHLSDVTARMIAAGDTLRIDSLTGRAGNGTIAGSGTIGVLAQGMPVNLVITAKDATPLSGGVVTATADANLAISGQVQNRLTLGGTVDVRQATVRIPSKLPTTVATIPVRIAGAPPPPPPKPVLAPVIAMDLTIRAPEQVFLRGRGLNAELGGTIRIQGTTKEMQPRGGFTLRRGTFNLVGSTLTFTSGDIDFNGGNLTDPAIHLVASSYGGGTTATLTVAGTASHPKLTLSSVPELPQDQILAQLLFHTSTGQLSAFQLASIAAGLAELSGTTSNFPNPLENLQNALGLDQLGIGSSANGSPTLQAGRYIGRRFYVGAQESTGGSGAQGKITYDLTKGLKLNATAGTGETTSAIGATGQSTGASVGITYQFEY